MSEDISLFWSKAAALKAGLEPDEWYGWIFKAVPGKGLFVTGAECPLITRGPRKGQPNLRMADQSTRRRVFLTLKEMTP